MKSVSELINQFKQILKSLGSPLGDFNQYSNIYIILRSIASVISEQYIYLNKLILNTSILTATGEDLDNKALEYSLYRIAGSSAKGTALISSSIPIELPSNTIFNSPNNYQFKTTEDKLITTNGVFVSIESLLCNESTNIESNIRLNSALYPNVKVVVGSQIDVNGNLQGGLTGGVSKETDTAFRQRTLNYLANLSKGTIGIIYNTLLESGINKFFIQENYPVTGYFTVFVDTQDKQVLDILENNIFLVKPVGVAFEIKTITNQYIDLRFNVSVSSVDSISSISDSIKTICYNYANNLGLGETVYPINFTVLCSNILGVIDIRLIDPTSNQIVVQSNSLIKLRNVFITFNEG